MSRGLVSYVAQRHAEAEAAMILAEAIERAKAKLKSAGVEEPDDVLQAIWEADSE